jgi:hypothetical protein
LAGILTATSTGIFSTRGSGIVGIWIDTVEEHPASMRAARPAYDARRRFFVKLSASAGIPGMLYQSDFVARSSQK